MRSTAKLPGFKPSDWPILAAGKVRHVGEPIAMARSPPAEAEDLAALVEVDFEPLPPVVTMADALKKAPPFVHDEWGDNVLVDIKLEAGDLNAAKAAAVHVIERSFRMNRMHPLPLEGRACIAAYDSRLDELVVYVAHQLPVPLQIGLAQVLGISQRRVRVVVPDVGASFGLKTYVESETVALPARRCSFAVRCAGFRIVTSRWSAMPPAATTSARSPATRMPTAGCSHSNAK